MASCYWAHFTQIGDHVFRFDTRVYMQPVDECRLRDHVIGGIIAKNPGSALAGVVSPEIQEIDLNHDKLLPTVRQILLRSFQRANRELPARGYVQVLNLFYLCGKTYSIARRSVLDVEAPPVCPGESRVFPWLWYAWGNAPWKLPGFAERFKALAADRHFYYDFFKKRMVYRHPNAKAYPKHTQGLKQEPVLKHLATLL